MLKLRDFSKILLRPFLLLLTVLWMESVTKVWCLGTLFDRGFGYMLLFSLPAALVFSLAAQLWKPTVNRLIAYLLTGLLTVWYGAQTVYHTIFKTFFTLESLSVAGEAITDFWQNAVNGIVDSLVPIGLLLLPLVLMILCEVFQNKINLPAAFTAWEQMPKRMAACLLVLVIVLQVISVAAVRRDNAGILSPSVLYSSVWEPELSVSNFGVLTTLRLNAQRLLGWPGESADEPAPTEPSEPALSDPEPDAQPPVEPLPETPGEELPPVEVLPEPEPEPVYEPNILDIDFETLAAESENSKIAEMHTYFGSKEPTMKNLYTGMFEGKNLLFFTAEGFWKYAVNETYTPTLYKLANEGFVFSEFYNPLWWKSTTDGEYVACTGLIPSGNAFSFEKSGSNAMPFCMGNMLRDQGYPTLAYHNHTYTYYDRHISHPNMGYDYYGIGNGLEVKKVWPASDLEMMEKTLPQTLAGEKPFHNYYMTVSGHMNYNFIGNSMAYKHRQEVADLDMSEEARAYLACNMELDQALAYTLEQLEAAGELENTVICISGDHYPYGMQPETWNEFYGGEIDQDFELYRSSLIIWSGDMEEPILIDKPCCSLDILPTLLNLFGLEYDSRLFAGRDILSDAPGIAIFSNRSFLTEEGRYNARTDTWIPNEGSEAGMDYAAEMYQYVKSQFSYSVKILDNDYYSLLGLDQTE